MNLIDRHIHRHLLHLQFEEDISFQKIYNLIQSDVKDKSCFLLQYIHLLLNETFSNKRLETNTLHLHFDYKLEDDFVLVIAQYLLIRSFVESNKAITSSSQNTDKLKSLKATLNSKLKKLSPCPDRASGKNGGNKIYKNWIKDKGKVNSLIMFYDQFDENIEIVSNAIFNCRAQLSFSLSNVFETNPYACDIENYTKYLTFNLLNSKLTLNQIDEVDNSVIDNLKTIILFDCERKKKMQYFSKQDIIGYEIDLRNYLIITFGNKNTSIQKLRDKINLVQSRFKIAPKDSYPIIRSEIDFLLGRETKRNIPVSFIGNETFHFWDVFLLEANIQDLYELRSIKMLNLYSLCFNREIKDYILQEIFSEKNTSDLISDETKQRLLDLRNEDLLILKESLGNVLDLIISKNLDQIIIDKTNNGTLFIVDNLVLKSEKLSGLISASLFLTEKNKLFSWSTFNDAKNSPLIILSYQDQGKYPYYFYPNIIETTVSQSLTVEAIFHKFLFFKRYMCANYNVSKDIYKLTDHSVRRKYFNWERLKTTIKNSKCQNDDTKWDLEQQYSGVNNRETIKLKLINERERTFNNSELFIYSTDNYSFKVERLGDLIELIDEDVRCFVHQIDEIQKNINLYDKMIDTKEQEKELNIIRQQFQIDNTETGRLWKILLKKKTTSLSEDELYNQLKVYLESKGLRIVSINHFKNNWLNPESDSMAPLNKKVFVGLCEFLELPKTYFILIQRLRNASKQSTRQSTLQMNRLLQNLFNDGCFDEGVDLNKIIANKLEDYKREHPLDELGIDERRLGENLITLVELIKPEITLKEIEIIRKTE